MPLGVYERKMRECVCEFCGRAFTAYGARANCCGSDECKKAKKAKAREAARAWMRRKRATEAAKKAPVVRVCEMCGTPVEKLHRFCSVCMKKRKRKHTYDSHKRSDAIPRVRGGDGSGKWRDGRYSMSRKSLDVRLNDKDVTVGAAVPYIDPDRMRVEWRH